MHRAARQAARAGSAAELRSVLELKPSTPKGLVLQSTYAGTLNCQRNSLSQVTQSGREQFAIPDRFKVERVRYAGLTRFSWSPWRVLPPFWKSPVTIARSLLISHSKLASDGAIRAACPSRWFLIMD